LTGVIPWSLSEINPGHDVAASLAPYAVEVTTRVRAPQNLVPWLVDATIALGLTAISLITLASGATDVGGTDPLSVTLLLLETLPLIVRRRWPIPVSAVTVAATVGHAFLVEGQVANESLGALVALFTVAERYERRVAVVAGLITAVSFAAVIIAKTEGGQIGVSGLLSTMLALGIVLGLGDWSRTRHRYAAAIEENARLQEAGRDEVARRAVEDERERIARELHDIVTHHVSVIVIQAGAGLTALDRRPEGARSALEAIDRTGREALTDMRRMLGILGETRETSASPAAGDTTREPMPGLERLGRLIEEVRAAGLPVELSMEGIRPPLDAGIELSAYRIIQEALTNALKHARGARARVRLVYEPRAIDIEVTDEGGTGRRDVGDGTSGGRGLIGMRERVALYSGAFEAAPTPNGFRVRARLPIDLAPVSDR
jgi:signal transduction histidine kinase